MTSKLFVATVLFFISSIVFLQKFAADEVVPVSDTGSLWLVNRDNPLSSCYKPENLVSYNGILLQETARNAFVQMLNAMEQDGVYGLQLQSAYRSYDYQQSVFSRKVQELMTGGYSQPEITAAQSIQPAGSSEHQLGLALDVSMNGELTQSFGETRAGRWLEEHSHIYGFIIRYPISKTDITQIVYEPWHLRYVGTPHSTIMKNLELTLEEYLSYIKEVQMYISWGEEMEYWLIIYTDTLSEILPQEAIVAVSSLNSTKSEYIVTKCKTYPGIW